MPSTWGWCLDRLTLWRRRLDFKDLDPIPSKRVALEVAAAFRCGRGSLAVQPLIYSYNASPRSLFHAVTSETHQHETAREPMRLLLPLAFEHRGWPHMMAASESPVTQRLVARAVKTVDVWRIKVLLTTARLR
jgi:hypothetical protein